LLGANEDFKGKQNDKADLLGNSSFILKENIFKQNNRFMKITGVLYR
jgi:hypothetical protein